MGRSAITPTDRFRTRKQPKQRRSAETRQRILAAAAHIFAQHGYAAGTTNRIAEHAEVSIGSLYQYFPNKDAILCALMTVHSDAGIERFRRQLSGALPPRLDDTLRVFVRATIDNHRDDPRLHRVLFEEAPRAPALLAHLREMERQLVDAAAVLLAPHSRVQVNRLQAHIVVATIESLVHRLMTGPEPADPQQLEDEIVVLLTGYVNAQQHPAKPA